MSSTHSLHYRLRAIRGGPFGLVNFTPHFIVIQIFQILFYRLCHFISTQIFEIYLQRTEYTFLISLFMIQLIINLKKGRDELIDICPLRTAQKFAIKYLLFQKSIFTMKGASVKVAILNFFTRQDPFIYHAKFHLLLRPPSSFL